MQLHIFFTLIRVSQPETLPENTDLNEVTCKKTTKTTTINNRRKKKLSLKIPKRSKGQKVSRRQDQVMIR